MEGKWQKLNAIYNLLEGKIEETHEWWKDKSFVEELDKRYEALENGSDKGFAIEELKESIAKLRKSSMVDKLKISIVISS